MELRQLAYFVAVAEERNFTRAARGIPIAQPAISQQIRRLEAELGERLFVRDRRRIGLTAAGEALLPHARRCSPTLSMPARPYRHLADCSPDGSRSASSCPFPTSALL